MSLCNAFRFLRYYELHSKIEDITWPEWKECKQHKENSYQCRIFFVMFPESAAHAADLPTRLSLSFFADTKSSPPICHKVACPLFTIMYLLNPRRVGAGYIRRGDGVQIDLVLVDAKRHLMDIVAGSRPHSLRIDAIGVIDVGQDERRYVGSPFG